MQLSIWLSEPQIAYAEIAHSLGIRRMMLDVEHGLFPPRELDAFMAFARMARIRVLIKVKGANAEAIQHALDVGADGVVIPHIHDAAHAAEICQVAKYPPQGSRSFFGGRPVGYVRPDTSFFEAENRRIGCYPLIELPSALQDVEAIAALDVVDGLFPGPTDLALSSGRGSYRFDDVDRAAIVRCAQAAQRAGKHWIMPGWQPAERALAKEWGAAEVVVTTQFMAIRAGLNTTLQSLRQEGLLNELAA